MLADSNSFTAGEEQPEAKAEAEAEAEAEITAGWSDYRF